jgi:hypothetical protein
MGVAVRPVPSALWASGVFLVACVARMLGAILAPGIHHPDEVFQSLEQAHRVIFGYGFVPWEFEHGIRSWLLPGAVAAAMRVGLLFGEGPQAYLTAVQVMLSALGAAAATCIFLWTLRLFGLLPALLGAVFPVFAPEMVYFAPRALTEVVAGHLLVVGLYLALSAPARWRIALAGFLLCLSVAIRLQLAPAVAIVGLYALWRWPPQRSVTLAGGGLAAAILWGLTDWWTWGTPFLSAWQNLRYNVGLGVAAHFGVEPWFRYPGLLVFVFGGALAAIVPLAVIGARFMPLLVVLMIAIFAPHQAIAHKEIRFLYPLMVLAEALAALGFAAVVAWLRERLPRLGLLWRPERAWLARGALLAGLVLFVTGRIVSFIIIPDQGFAWLKQRDFVQSALHVSRLPGVCGIGSYSIDWVASGGYAHMHQPVPFHAPTTLAGYREALPAFNTILYRKGDEDALVITGGTCFGQRCVAQRPGGCEARLLEPLPFQPPQIRDIAPLKQLWPPASFPPRR